MLLESWVNLLGLSDQNAFECVGETDETRCAMYRAYKRGLKGKAIDLFISNNLDKLDYYEIEKKYDQAFFEETHIPTFVLEKIKDFY